MSRELHDLKVALTQAHPDSVYIAWLTVKQTMSLSADNGTLAILGAIVDLLDASYAEKENAA